MAIEDALEVILSEWHDIESLLTVRGLTVLASLTQDAMRGTNDYGRPAPVFRAVATALAADLRPGRLCVRDSIWGHGNVQPRGGCGSDQSSRVALGDPLSATDAAADALAKEGRATLLRIGVVPADAQTGGGEFWPPVRDGERLFCPLS